MATLLFEQSLYLYLRHGAAVSTNVPFYHALEQRVAQLTGLERKIADYLSEHYCEDVTLDQLADHLRYSKNYLCKVFKSATGFTISEYINFLKIRKAYELVCCTDQKAFGDRSELRFHQYPLFFQSLSQMRGVCPFSCTGPGPQFSGYRYPSARNIPVPLLHAGRLNLSGCSFSRRFGAESGNTSVGYLICSYFSCMMNLTLHRYRKERPHADFL